VQEVRVVLTLEQVEHVANLAKLALTDEEAEAYRQQLSAILEYAAILERLDTDAIAPTASVLPLCNVMRADQPGPSLSSADALANAPSAMGEHFQVKAVLER
jgi:aspartyl-tRNA(Asn)/glutamyl-tRNA(Gln) amidotransferase subunit C